MEIPWCLHDDGYINLDHYLNGVMFFKGIWGYAS